MRTTVLRLTLIVASLVTALRADVAVLLAEPYGGFGSVNPTGHAAIFLNRVCAASPTRLRRCGADELGVVISRYHKIAEYDWLAIPLLPYLYAVESPREVPEFADAQKVLSLRDSYRRRYLSEVVSDSASGQTPEGNWVQLVGAAYDRKIFAFQIETTEKQDEEFIREFNARPNRSRFNLLFRNCADLVRGAVNLYYRGAIKRSIVADAGITTPKQVANSLVRYARKHPELQFAAYIIPQIPGSRPPSSHVRGVLESLIKSKKYAVPLVAANLWITPGLTAGYFAKGRFNPSRYAVTVCGPFEVEQRVFLAVKSSPQESAQTHDIAHATVATPATVGTDSINKLIDHNPIDDLAAVK